MEHTARARETRAERMNKKESENYEKLRLNTQSRCINENLTEIRFAFSLHAPNGYTSFL